jgi:hypothetical protein
MTGCCSLRRSSFWAYSEHTARGLTSPGSGATAPRSGPTRHQPHLPYNTSTPPPDGTARPTQSEVSLGASCNLAFRSRRSGERSEQRSAGGEDSGGPGEQPVEGARPEQGRVLPVSERVQVDLQARNGVPSEPVTSERSGDLSRPAAGRPMNRTERQPGPRTVILRISPLKYLSN